MEIVAGLRASMAELGYEKSTVQTIASKAGLAPGLIHYHFKNKEEILLQLVKTLAEVSRARYEDLAAAAIRPQEKLRAYIESRLALGPGANPDAVGAWVVIGAEALRQTAVRTAYRNVIAAELEIAEELMRAWLAAEGKDTARAPGCAATLITFMEGAFQLASAAPDLMPAGYAAGAALDLATRFVECAATAATRVANPRKKSP